jgi:ParB/RepB/Spo0J family partition protein
MAFTADTGSYKATRQDVFLVDPRALIVDWHKNFSRGGVEPIVDDALLALARDMMPRDGAGDATDGSGSSGQINPILVRPLPDRRLEVIGGFRRMRAALYLIESGECPEFRIKYIVSRMSDAEASLANLSENLQREDPRPIQLAHAIRSLTEDFGFTIKAVATRLKKSPSWCSSLLDLVMLPAPIQAEVDNGNVPVRAAVELNRVGGGDDRKMAIFNALTAGGERVTVDRVKAKRREESQANGARPETEQHGSKERFQSRSMAALKAFLESKTGIADAGHNLAGDLLDFLAGRVTDDFMASAWDQAFNPEGAEIGDVEVEVEAD